MNITFDEIWARLVKHGLATDGIRPSDQKRVRYSTEIMVGITNEDQTEFMLRVTIEDRNDRAQIDAFIRELFRGCENVKIGKSGGIIRAGSTQ